MTSPGTQLIKRSLQGNKTRNRNYKQGHRRFGGGQISSNEGRPRFLRRKSWKQFDRSQHPIIIKLDVRVRASVRVSVRASWVAFHDQKISVTDEINKTTEEIQIRVLN